MDKPERTDWSRTTPVPWTSSDRATYIEWYDETYPSHGWYWPDTQIHHIRPRSYGGTNDYSNLIPISTWDHYRVTAWWNNY